MSLLQTVDIWSYRIIGLGFPFLTIGIISGAVWANEGMGWKYVGVKYSFYKVLKDLKQAKWVYGALIKGLPAGEIKSISCIIAYCA